MSTEPTIARRRRVQIPFLTILVVAAIAAGLAIGVQALRSPTSAGAIPAVWAPSQVPTTVVRHPDLNERIPPVTSPAVGKAASRVPGPRTTPVVPSQACVAMDPTAYGMYCGSSHGTPIAAPRAVWQACEAMDATAYRHYCAAGDGGRWIAAQ